MRHRNIRLNSTTTSTQLALMH